MIKVELGRTMQQFLRFGVLFTTVYSASLYSQTNPTPLYFQPIPHYMNSTEDGRYVDLMRRFSAEYEHDFEFLMASSERIEKLLVKSVKNLCSLGFSVELAVTEGLPTEHLIESQSFNRIYTSIISTQKAKVSSVRDLNQKTLVVYYGNKQDAIERIPVGYTTNVVSAYNIDALINTVFNGRVDAGFVTTPDIFMSPLYQSLASQLHLVELPESDRREALVCIGSDENRALIKRFDEFIDKLRESGELNQYIDYHVTMSNKQ